MDTVQQTTTEVVDLIVQASAVTKNVLQTAMQEFLSGNAQKRGKVSYGKLAKQGKLDNIEVTENNIQDFLKTARKYDVDFALKRDKSTEPPTYHIFFTSKNADNFTKAFKEYAYGVSKKLDKDKAKSVTKVVNREQIKQNAKTISNKQAKKSKEKHKTRTNSTR